MRRDFRVRRVRVSPPRACLDRLAATHGALDGLVCTPSINVRKPILAYTGDEFDRVVRVNLRGNFNVLQSAGRIMTAQKRGSIEKRTHWVGFEE